MSVNVSVITIYSSDPHQTIIIVKPCFSVEGSFYSITYFSFLTLLSFRQVLSCLIRGLYTLVEQRALSLLVLHSLMGDTKLVKECLQFGKFLVSTPSFSLFHYR